MANGHDLHQHLLNQNMPLLVLMLNRGADINSINADEMTLLHVAAKLQYEKEVEMLLERGANVNVTDKAGNTPLHYGIQSVEIVSALLAKGALPDCVNLSEEGPLHCAVGRGNLPVITLLINAGANVNIKNKFGSTILHYSIQQFNSYQFKSNLQIIKLLIENGANVNAEVFGGKRPLHIAANQNNFSAVKLLLEYGADPNVIEQQLHFECLKLKLPNFKLHSTRGTTALHYAANNENLMMTELLLECGADPNIMDEFGKTPLHRIVHCPVGYLDDSDLDYFLRLEKHLEVAELLLKSGAIVNNERTTTPLHLSVHNRNSRMLKLLIKYGADVDVKDFDGNTPLHTALYLKNEINIEALLDCGASLDFVDKDFLSKRLMNKSISLIRHSVKLQSISLICNKLLNWKDFESFQISCLEELKNMKEIKHGSHSVFDLLFKYDDPYFVSNSLLEQEIIDAEGKFPIYHLILYSTFLRAKHRYNMLNEVQEYFNVDILPLEIKRKILTYFSDKDLKRIIKAVKNET